MMKIPYSEIISIKILYSNINKTGIVNRLKRFAYKRVVDRIKRILLNSINIRTFIYNDDLENFCRFMNVVYHEAKHKWVSVITYGDGDYKIKMNEFFGYYTTIEIKHDYSIFNITSSNPYSSILSRNISVIDTGNSDSEKRIYEMIVNCITDYLDM